MPITPEQTHHEMDPLPRTRRLAFWGLLGVITLGLVAAMGITGVSIGLERGEAAGLCGDGFTDCTSTLTGEWARLFGVRLSVLASVLFGFLLLHGLARGVVYRDPQGVFGTTLMIGYGAAALAVFYLVLSVVVLETLCAYCSLLQLLVLGMLALAYVGARTPLRRQPGLFRRSARGLKQGIVAAVSLLLAVGGVALAETVRPLPPEVPIEGVVGRYLNNPQVDMAPDTVESLELAQIGPPEARLHIVQFADFACSACQRSALSLEVLRSAHPEDVRLTFVNFPICSDCNPVVKHRKHPRACSLAELAIAMRMQGRFWEFHSKLFRIPGRRARAKQAWDIAAEVAGADLERVRARIDSGEAGEALRKECLLSGRLGVRATPTFLLNDRLVRGAPPLEHLEEILRYEMDPVAYRIDQGRQTAPAQRRRVLPHPLARGPAHGSHGHAHPPHGTSSHGHAHPHGPSAQPHGPTQPHGPAHSHDHHGHDHHGHDHHGHAH